MPRCKECVYVPDLDEWFCAVCLPGRRAVVRALARFRGWLGVARELDQEGDELEDEPAEFDADELGLDTEDE